MAMPKCPVETGASSRPDPPDAGTKHLEVVNQHGTSTVWDDPFLTDGLAWQEFPETLEREGLREFFGKDESFGRLH